MLELDCPALSNTEQEFDLGDKKAVFDVECGVNHSGATGAEDLARLTAYTFDDCLIACANYNNLGVTDKTCVAAHFNTKLMNKQGGNCWLKSKIGKPQDVEEEKKNDLVEGYLKD